MSFIAVVSKPSSIIGKIKYLSKNITLEPVCFIFALNFGFYAIASKQLYIEKVCTVNLNHTIEICDNLRAHQEIRYDNQELVTRLSWISKIIQSVPPLVYSLFAGPWCDKHGRKPLIIISIFGYAISNSVFLINTIWWYELKAEYLLLESLQDLSGGGSLFYLGTYSMYADMNKGQPAKFTTVRLAVVDGLIYLGFYVGNAMAGPVKNNLGLEYNFALGILFSVIAAAYTIIYIKETLVQPEVVTQTEENEHTKLNKDDYHLYEGIWVRSSDGAQITCSFRLDGNLKCKWHEGGPPNSIEVTKSSLTWDKDPMVKGSYENGCITWSNGSIWTKDVTQQEKEMDTSTNQKRLFGTINIEPILSSNPVRLVKIAVLNSLEGFQTVLKKRPHNIRFCLIMLIAAFLVEMFTNYAWGNYYMYYRLKLQFGMSDFTTLMSIAGICGLAGQFVFVPLFTKTLNFHASAISLLDAFTSMIKNFIIAFASKIWMLYFSSGIGFLDSTTTTVMRSMIISLVPVSEIGKVFCVVEFFKGILQFAGPIIYGVLYEKTVRTVPQAFLYMQSGCKCIVFIASIIIYIELNKLQKLETKKEYSHKKDDELKQPEETPESTETP